VIARSCSSYSAVLALAGLSPAPFEPISLRIDPGRQTDT
jgi:hypothetical protein